MNAGVDCERHANRLHAWKAQGFLFGIQGTQTHIDQSQALRWSSKLSISAVGLLGALALACKSPTSPQKCHPTRKPLKTSHMTHLC